MIHLIRDKAKIWTWVCDSPEVKLSIADSSSSLVCCHSKIVLQNIIIPQTSFIPLGKDFNRVRFYWWTCEGEQGIPDHVSPWFLLCEMIVLFTAPSLKTPNTKPFCICVCDDKCGKAYLMTQGTEEAAHWFQSKSIQENPEPCLGDTVQDHSRNTLDGASGAEPENPTWTHVCEWLVSGNREGCSWLSRAFVTRWRLWKVGGVSGWLAVLK